MVLGSVGSVVAVFSGTSVVYFTASIWHHVSLNIALIVLGPTRRDDIQRDFCGATMGQKLVVLGRCLLVAGTFKFVIGWPKQKKKRDNSGRGPVQIEASSVSSGCFTSAPRKR